jgi:GDP-4-dehydro-6-deoxy-D-mannose reductase
MKVLVTGADGFVGRHLVARLVQTGHAVTAACRPGASEPDWGQAVRTVPFELTDGASMDAAVKGKLDAVVHLAAVASNREATADPGLAWVINAAGTARLVEALLSARAAGEMDPVVLIVSSAEVYGPGSAGPRREQDPASPNSPYAASKLGAELAALEAWRRSGLRVMVARPFTHTGPGQRPPFVVPSFVERLLAARSRGATRVPTGNLDPVRDMLDVRDVVQAYLALLTRGQPGETYNVARGQGISLRELFQRVAAIVGVSAEPVADPSLQRAGDIPHLVGDPAKLHRATGWVPGISLDQTLRDMVHAQAR